MALAPSSLTFGFDQDGGSTAASASISPGANSLVLAAVLNIDGDFSSPATPSLSGNGLTWTQVATLTYGPGGIARLTLFRAMGSAPSTGAVTISFGGVGQFLVGYSISQFAGADTSGTNGSGAIVQSDTGFNASGTGLTITLDAFGSTDNMAYGVFSYGLDAESDLGVGSGFTLLNTVSSGGEDAMLTEYKLNDNTVDATQATAQAMAGIAVEIKAAGGGGSVQPPRTMHQFRQRRHHREWERRAAGIVVPTYSRFIIPAWRAA